MSNFDSFSYFTRGRAGTSKITKIWQKWPQTFISLQHHDSQENVRVKPHSKHSALPPSSDSPARSAHYLHRFRLHIYNYSMLRTRAHLRLKYIIMHFIWLAFHLQSSELNFGQRLILKIIRPFNIQLQLEYSSTYFRPNLSILLKTTFKETNFAWVNHDII